jgi:hypothetical protein
MHHELAKKFDSIQSNNKDIGVVIEKADEEVRFGGFVADAIVNDNLNIEIFVTHRVDDKKIKLIKERNLNTIEINMKNIGRDILKKDKIKEYLLNGENTKVLHYDGYNFDEEEIKKNIFKEFRKELENQCLEKILEVNKIDIDEYLDMGEGTREEKIEKRKAIHERFLELKKKRIEEKKKRNNEALSKNRYRV